MDGSLPGERAAIYDRGGWAFWMLFRLMGEPAGLAGLRDYIATYRDSRDHPLIEEFLAVMRRHAPDPAAFDSLAGQWILGTVMPQVQVTDAKVVREGKGWRTTALVKNVGDGTVLLKIAAVRGERFAAKPKTPYWDVRTTVTLKPGEEKRIEIRGDAKPERLVVDPDVELLMLERSKATARLSE